jgi:xylulokinase
MKTIVCGIDSSTQSCTVVARHPDTGEVLSFGRAPHPKTSPPRSEQSPADWWSALRIALREFDRGSIGAVSIDGQGHGSVLLDASGVVLRQAKLWNDTETKNESRELIERIGKSEWIRLTSIVPVPAFTIAKLLWIRRHEPEVLRRCRKILLPHDWLVYALSGRFVTDRSEASGTGYFSPATTSWHPELLDLVDPDIDWEPMLPDVAGPDEIVGTVSASAAEELGIPAGIPIAPGCNDNPASALGLGLRNADVCISLGTSGTVFAPSGLPVFDQSGYVNGNADATGAFLPLVCTLNAAKVTDWMCRVFGVGHEEAARLALSAPAKTDRPIVVPFFDGERTPNLPQAMGSISGLRTDTTREQLLRACYEGVLLGIASGAGCPE